MQRRSDPELLPSAVQGRQASGRGPEAGHGAPDAGPQPAREGAHVPRSRPRSPRLPPLGRYVTLNPSRSRLVAVSFVMVFTSVTESCYHFFVACSDV